MDEMPGSGADQGARRRITPIDVQQKVFRRATLRGYHEQDVDDFLDEVTEELALLLDEVRQLRERSGLEPVANTDTAEALRTADDIVRQAREEAAEILRRARDEAGATGGSGSSLNPFLARERTFLADLSKLIQGHAEAVREMARTRRSGAPPAPSQPGVAVAGDADAVTDTIEVGEAEPSEPAEGRVS
jgi:DivIVA domain-containing protein